MQDIYIIIGLGIVALIVASLLSIAASPRRRRYVSPVAEAAPPANAIIVDGSNVMHWGSEASTKVLSQVLRSAERAGYVPIVFFDANVGYIIDDHYYDEAKLAQLIGIDPQHICVVNKGVIADEAILAFASDYKLRVITNDKYRDWRVRFPHAAKKGMLLGGTWRDGTVVWRGRLQKQVVRA